MRGAGARERGETPQFKITPRMGFFGCLGNLLVLALVFGPLLALAWGLSKLWGVGP